MLGQQRSYGSGKIEDERETVEVGGFGMLARLRKHREQRIKHWLSQSSDTLMGLAAHRSWKKREGDLEKDKRRQRERGRDQNRQAF